MYALQAMVVADSSMPPPTGTPATTAGSATTPVALADGVSKRGKAPEKIGDWNRRASASAFGV